MEAIVRVNELFSETVYASYKRKRYGMKTCSAVTNEELTDDLRNLLIRSQEQEACECVLPGTCTLTAIEERINTL
jgi:hypothetical protein